MDNINDIIASLTPDDIQALKDTAESIFGQGNNQNTSNFQEQANNINSSNFSSPFGFDFGSMPDPEMFIKLKNILSVMNSDGGKRCHLIEALKPNLSQRRQKKADEAIQILKLLEVLPMLTKLTNRGE